MGREAIGNRGGGMMVLFRSPMTAMMAAFTQSYDIEAMVWRIAQMMMIFTRWFAAVETREFRWSGQCSSLDRKPHGIGGHPLFLGIVRASRTRAPYSDTATRNTSGSQPIAAGPVWIEFAMRLPESALTTVLQSLSEFGLVLFGRQAGSLCGDLDNAFIRSHN
jgi:hypothetical protein